MPRIVPALFVAALFVCVAAGCAPARQPLQADPAFIANPPSTIVILPSVDARVDKTKIQFADFQKLTQDAIEEDLKGKNYQVVRASSFGPNSPAPEAVAEMTEAELTHLRTGQSSPVFVYFLEDLAVNYVVVSKSVKFEGRAILFDPTTGKVLWKDKEADSFGHIGLILGLFPIDNRGAVACIRNMLRSFPPALEK